MSRVSAAFPAALAAALALATAPSQLRTAWSWLQESPSGIRRDEESARRELRGEPYAAALAQAAARIPAGSAYGLADEGGPGPDRNWVRCDLAPRIPVQLRPGRCGSWFFERSPREVPEVTVVVARDGGVSIAATRSLLTSLWSGLPETEVEVPGWIDAPAEDASTGPRVVVSGWCQEKGGRPCSGVRIWVDGAEVDAARLERFPRPDVQASVPDIGDCSRAGWRLTFEAGALAPGRHCVAAALVADGGRHRKVGPWAFRVTR